MSVPTDQPVQADQPPRRPRRFGTVRAMLLSTVVIAAIVLLLVLLVPRPTSVPRVSIDLASAASAAKDRVGFEPAVAVPNGWTVTSADVRTDTDGLATWTVNYLTDSGRYVGLMQAPGWTPKWQSSLTQGGTPAGQVTVGGQTWTVLVKAEREITTLMVREPKRTTLILAKEGGTADAGVLAAKVKLGS